MNSWTTKKKERKIYNLAAEIRICKLSTRHSLKIAQGIIHSYASPRELSTQNLSVLETLL